MDQFPADSAPREQYLRDGFLAMPRVFDSAAVDEVARLLDPLFDRFESLPPRMRRDLGAGDGDASVAVRSAEIDRPSRLARELLETTVFATCRQIARDLVGRPARYMYDHAIYKAPRNQRATPWHQDHAYSGHRRLLDTVHFWIPLQPASVSNGCMQFVPGSHRRGLLAHQAHGNRHTLSLDPPPPATVVACPLPKGGCTVHSPLTLHYTGANHSDDVRRAWIVHFGPWGRLAKLHPSILAERLRESLRLSV